MIVPLADPVTRTVARIDMPSHRRGAALLARPCMPGQVGRQQRSAGPLTCIFLPSQDGRCRDLLP